MPRESGRRNRKGRQMAAILARIRDRPRAGRNHRSRVDAEVPERRTIRCRHLDSIIDTEGSALKHLQFPKKSQPVFGQVQSGLEQSSNDVLLQGRLQRPSMWYYMLYDRRNPMDASKWRAFWDTTVFLLRVKQDLL